ncbi:hypothetical protein [Mycetocola sp. 2940]|uniref:hypothetical protein n=1 Tax=Mycetocola sp. 2940 TaxID=3156452 RepID=UPI003398B3D9
MTDSSRSVMALASLGVGLVHLAVGAGSPLFLAILLVGFGIAELGWGVALLVRGRVVLPRAALPLALAPVALWGLDITASVALGGSGMAASLPFGPMAAASALSFFLGAGLAFARRRPPAPLAASAARPGRYLLGMTLGAMLVAGLVTPALAGTNAGTAAVPHGEHGTSTLDDEPTVHSGH